jgi:hypothetical protein
MLRVGTNTAVISLFVFPSACSHAFTKGELVGEYTLKIKGENATLELRDSGEYIHHYRERDLPEQTVTGKWDLDNTADGQAVTLTNFSLSSREKAGFYLLWPSRFFGSIHLGRGDPDQNEFYEKR